MLLGHLFCLVYIPTSANRTSVIKKRPKQQELTRDIRDLSWTQVCLCLSTTGPATMIKYLVLVVCLQAAVTVVECCGNKKPVGSSKPVTDEGSYIEICKQEPLELSIVLDASLSVANKDFETAKSFVEDVVSQFEVAPGRQGVRVSVITYGRYVFTQEGFNLTTYNNKEDVLAAICNIKHGHGDWTRTDLAIAYMHQVQLASDVVRPSVDRISVVITDGDSTFPEKTKAAAEAARQAGIKLFAVGVGNVKQSELLNIAGDTSRVIAVANYEKLNSIKKLLSSKICTKIPKPTTPPPPKTKCGKLNPADVYFAFSSADLGLDGTTKATSFISKVITNEELDEGFRFGVISGICPDDAGFNLKAYSTVDQYRTRLGQYDINPLPRLTERLLGDAYSLDNGGRANASRVAVIITSGTGSEIDELTLQVEQLKQNGITVYIADPNGQAVTIDGAKALIGGSSTVQAGALITLLCPSI